MQRRNFTDDASARTIQVGGLMTVLLAVVVVLAHAMVDGGRTVTAAAQPQEEGRLASFNSHPGW